MVGDRIVKGMGQWLVLSVLLGCSGAATVPAPLAEIPAAISIPQDVGVDVSKISGGSSETAALKLLTQEELLSVIRIGPETVELVNQEILPGLLAPFSTFEIPVTPQTTTFQGTLVDPDAAPQVFKFDFADYDFDGDGAKDGFTGCTCPVSCALEACPPEAPLSELRKVGFRVWIQDSPEQGFRQILVGFFDRLPVKDDPATPEDEENPGKGQFRVGVSETGENEKGVEVTERFFIGVIYDHKDPVEELNLSTQAFLILETINAEGGVLFSNSNNSFVAQIAKVDSAGSRYLEKTVKSTVESFIAEGPEAGQGRELYLGRFREDADFWNGSFFREGTNMETFQVPTTCARISNATEVDAEICEDLGIDTSGESFLRGALESDVLFPADFPLFPPF